MKRTVRVLPSLLAWSLLLCVPAALAEVWRNHFDADGPSRPPAFFDFEVLSAPGDAKWIVLADHNPPSAPNQVTQIYAKRPQGSIAVALRRNVTLQDGRLSVALKKLPAWEGLVFRMAGERDFLALLVNGQSGEARLTAYRDGAPAQLARGKAVIDRDWGILTVSLAGATVSAGWNEKELLQAQDPKPASGRAGLATEGAGLSSFDEFVIETP
jgi:hypothetical protein